MRSYSERRARYRELRVRSAGWRVAKARRSGGAAGRPRRWIPDVKHARRGGRVHFGGQRYGTGWKAIAWIGSAARVKDVDRQRLRRSRSTACRDTHWMTPARHDAGDRHIRQRQRREGRCRSRRRCELNPGKEAVTDAGDEVDRKRDARRFLCSVRGLIDAAVDRAYLRRTGNDAGLNGRVAVDPRPGREQCA